MINTNLHKKCFSASLQDDVFWRNYFYRVSILKQSAELLADPEVHHDKESSSEKEVASAEVSAQSPRHDNGNGENRSSPIKSTNEEAGIEDKEVKEGNNKGEEDVLSDGLGGSSVDEGIEESFEGDWEKELAQELEEA